MNVYKKLNMFVDFDVRKLKLNGVDARIIKGKHAVECKN
jgi:hypothetical protein